MVKRSGEIEFNEGSHTYTNVNTGNTYTSVTTLIHKYVQPFDSDYWSTYKAIERLCISRKDSLAWRDLKRKAGGYDRVIAYVFDRAKKQDLADIELIKAQILKEWDTINKKACDKGTRIHAKKEHETLKEDNSLFIKKHKLFEQVPETIDLYSSETDLSNLLDGTYPELLIYNNVLEIAGQSDKVIVQTGIKDGIKYIDIDDYKTNKKLSFKSYYNHKLGTSVKMAYPVNHLDDCNFNHYQLQLSLYAWLLEQHGYTVRNITITYIPDEDSDAIIYKCEYLKKEIEAIIKDYEQERR